jgi:Bifunctional DNA primase/polymerase, N-terminal/Primase C terminal 1 (PriCT-1)
MRSAVIQTALSLAYKGLAVFPCRPRDKRPATASGVKDATTNLDTIRQWWRRNPEFNIAVATGAISGVFVIDVDGPDAEAELRKLEQEHGQLPPTVESITARGRHAFFKMPRSQVRNSVGRIAPGVDVRGDGGYVLAPRSIHPSGRPYAWSVDSAKEFASAPDWLISKVSESNSSCEKQASPAEWSRLATEGADEGQRNYALTRLCGYLLRRYIDPFVALEMLQLWNAAHCRPPLPAGDVNRIVESIAGREINRRLGHGGS